MMSELISKGLPLSADRKRYMVKLVKRRRVLVVFRFCLIAFRTILEDM